MTNPTRPVDRWEFALRQVVAERDGLQNKLAMAEAERDLLKGELHELQGARLVSAVFGHHPGAPRPFALHRREDVSGVSGTGVVALGAQFPDGTVVVRWLGEHPSTVTWDCMEHAVAVHGHDGRTIVVWLSEEFGALAEQEERERGLRARINKLLAHYENVVGTFHVEARPHIERAMRRLRYLLDHDNPQSFHYRE